MKNNTSIETSVKATGHKPLLERLKDSYKSKLSGIDFSKPYTTHGIIKGDIHLVIRGNALSKRSVSALTSSKIFPFIGFVKEFHDSAFASLLGFDYNHCGVFLVDDNTVIIGDKDTVTLYQDILVLKENHESLKAGTLLLDSDYFEGVGILRSYDSITVYDKNSNSHLVPLNILKEVDLDEYARSNVSFLDR